MLQFHVDGALCTRCHQCVRDCPARIIAPRRHTTPAIPEEKAPSCLQCQHCLAICPSGALSILGRRPKDSLPVEPERLPTLESMIRLVRGRRSVRQYRDANVDPALLQQLLTSAAYAPTGVNRHALTFTVIDDKDVMASLQRKVMAGLQAAAAAGRIPERFGYLHAAVSWPYEYGVKLLFRTAPHALLISAGPDAACPDQDIALTLAYFELLAHSAGLGTVWWGMLHMVLQVLPELKAELDLPAEHPCYGMLFGYPAVHYARTVQRDDAAPVRRVTLEPACLPGANPLHCKGPCAPCDCSS